MVSRFCLGRDPYQPGLVAAPPQNHSVRFSLEPWRIDFDRRNYSRKLPVRIMRRIDMPTRAHRQDRNEKKTCSHANRSFRSLGSRLVNRIPEDSSLNYHENPLFSVTTGFRIELISGTIVQ
jgi:hypothetical protein